ncbi:MAG TPA: zinc ribbon domain-containing protein [Roseiflexaceae bacterium]|nr:zinc ribbon domain-containing protein [Roseiflexaceae bacterium]
MPETLCPHCGATIPDDGLFCIECGRPVATPPATGATTRIGGYDGGPLCPACGTRNPAEADFCVLCGRAMTADALTRQQAAAASQQPGPPLLREVADRPRLDPLAPPPAAQLPAAPVPQIERPPRRKRREIPGNIMAAIMLFGLAALAVTGWWWPGILVVVGTLATLQALVWGNIRETVKRALWLFGLAVLAEYSLWWPGILVLVGLSILADTILPRRRR